MQLVHRGRIGMLVAGSVVIAGLSATGAVAAEPKPNSVVAGHSSWDELAYENTSTGAYLTPQQDDVAGPQRAPYGTNSHRMTIGESTVQTELYRTDSYDGTLLADITRLEYSTLARRTSGSGADRQPTYLRINVDNDGASASVDASLFFFPANNGNQQAVVNGAWQNWDVAGGKISVDGDDGPGSTTTIAAYAAAHPTATLVNNSDAGRPGGALALITGGASGGSTDPQANGTYFVDRVIVGEDDQDTLFDFGGNSESNGGTTAKTVSPGNLQGWKHQAYDDVNYLNSNQQFVNGPSAPPAGVGSLGFALSNDTNPDRVELFRTTRYDETLLRDLRTLEYNTFQRANAGNATSQQPVYLRLSLGNGDSLFFYPANNGPVLPSTWQNWDADSGKWNVDGDTGIAGAVSLKNYLVAHPDARIVENADATAPAQPDGGVAFIVGGGGASQMNGEYFLDDITISKVDNATGSTKSGIAFDLEPTAPPAPPAPPVRKAIEATLTLSNQRDGDNVAGVNAPNAAHGAIVKLFKIRTDGSRKLVATKTANRFGNARFVQNDTNGRRFTKYQAKVGATTRTFADFTPKRRIR